MASENVLLIPGPITSISDHGIFARRCVKNFPSTFGNMNNLMVDFR